MQIKFIGVGEKLQALEEFRPESMASRIMGQGDLMGLVEKVQQIQSQVSEEELKKQQEALEKGQFTLDDFRMHFQNIQKMGMKDMIGRMPGMAEMIPEGEDPEVALKRVQGMIDSMTKKERHDPDVIDAGRRRRIAAGAGVQPHEVSQFLKQFDTVRALMKQMMSMSVWQRIKMVTGLTKAGAFDPGQGGNAQDEGPHRPPQERPRAGRGAEEEEEEAVICRGTDRQPRIKRLKPDESGRVLDKRRIRRFYFLMLPILVPILMTGAGAILTWGVEVRQWRGDRHRAHGGRRAGLFFALLHLRDLLHRRLSGAVLLALAPRAHRPPAGRHRHLRRPGRFLRPDHPA